MKYVVYDANGAVLAAGECPPGSGFDHFAPHRVLPVEALPADLRACAVEHGALVHKAGRPDERHAWSAAARAWRVDPALVIAARNRRLLETDWTQMPDVPPATRAAFAGYRQSLRDVPQQSGYPTTLDWPAAPDMT